MEEHVERVLRGAQQIGPQRRVRRLRRRALQRVPDQRDLEADPRRDRGDRRHRRRRRVDDVGELLAGDPQPVGDRPHRVADDERVRVVVEEDDHAGQPGQELPAPL